MYPNRALSSGHCKGSFLYVYDNSFHFFSLKYMEKHTRLLESLRRIYCVDKINGKERKLDIAKHANEIQQIWKVSVLLVSRNVHPKYVHVMQS